MRSITKLFSKISQLADVAINGLSKGQVLTFNGSTWGNANTSTPRNYLTGLILSNDAGTPNTVIDIAIGIARDSTNLVDITLNSAFTKSLASTWVVGTGNGGLDTGTIASSTWYHVFAISNGSNSDILVSTSVTSPTLPSGYTYFRRIGSVKTDGSSHILAFLQVGDIFYWGSPVTDRSSTSAVSSALLAFSVPSGVSVAPLVQSNLYISSGDLGNSIGNASAGSANIAYQHCAGTNITNNIVSLLTYWTNNSSQLYFACIINSGTIVINSLITYGWVDIRGKL